MRGGALTPALLCAALGLSLASAGARAALRGFAVVVVVACAVVLVPVPGTWADAIFLGCCTSTIASAALVHSPRALKDKEGLGLSLNAGVWTGAVIALAPSKVALLEALPLALCAWPAAWARQRGRAIVLNVLASWLIALAVLAATLQFLSVTPGYLPDHMD